MTSGREVKKEETPPTTIISKTTEDLRLRIKQYLKEIIAPLLERNGNISIGVSGGSMPKLLCDVFSSLELKVDERLVPPTDKECTYSQYLELLPAHIKNCVVRVQVHDTPQKSALLYEQTLLSEVMPEKIGKIPRWDVLFLGMGPDGHTASLFPNHRLIKAGDTTSWVGWLDDSPKPPPSRVTLVLHSINMSRNVAFIITGESKADVVKAVIDRDLQYPSSLVKPMNGRLTFFLDEGAASKL